MIQNVSSYFSEHERRQIMPQLILASRSPRRKELLKRINVPFEVIGSDIEETIDLNLTPDQVAQSLAFQKSSYIAKKYPNAYVIGADTIVVFENKILGKPQDEDDAYKMISLLSGNTHSVLTGVSIIHGEMNITFHEQTEVTFWELSDKEIRSYIKSGEPFDKAGSYGIQQLGSLFVKEIKGDYFNIVGLPISRLYRELKKINFPFSK